MAESLSDLEVMAVGEADTRFDDVLNLADEVLDQRRYLVREFPQAIESLVLAAWQDGRPVGFLRLLVQTIGSAEGRPRVMLDGLALTEGFVEAFGVLPDLRRHGIGSALQAAAIEHCRSAGCYQIRSRSPVSSTENYALKLAAGYVLSPSVENDSYYFLLKL